MHARGAHHRAHRASGDHARPGRGRLHHDPAGSKLPDQLMRQSVFDQRHANQILLGSFDCFLDRQRHFARLAGAKPYVTGFVPDHHQRRERQILSALHHLGHAVDRDDLIFQIKSLS